MEQENSGRTESGEAEMIILTLGGRLGNQMFQYAFARKLQKETGD